MTTLTTRTAAIAITLGLAAFAPSTAVAQSCGDTIVADTTLTGPLSGCAGPGLIVGADNITLDCANYTITGTGVDVGIRLAGVSGVELLNCVVIDFANGIVVGGGSTSNYLFNNGALNGTSGGGGGIVIAGNSNGNVLETNRTSGNAGRGFAIVNSNSNLLQDNAAVANGFRGYDVINANGNALLRNLSSQNLSAGVVVQGTSVGNILFDNQVDSSGSEGFAMFASPNWLAFNASDNNGTWGIRDTTGPANGYVLNTCVANPSGTSNPAGLCF